VYHRLTIMQLVTPIIALMRAGDTAAT